MKTGYIYMFRNKVNQKCYIGKTTNIKSRYYSHVNAHKRKSYIQKAITKYGIDNFEFIVLENICCDDQKMLNAKLNDLEKYYIEKYDSYKSGYNLTLGGDGALGAIRSDESKKLYSESKKGNKNPAKSDAVKEKISNTLKQYFKEHGPNKMSDEGRARLRENMLGEKNPMYGKSAMKNKHYPKLLWVDLNGDLHEMSIIGKKVHHPDWVLYDDYIKSKNNETNEQQ